MIEISCEQIEKVNRLLGDIKDGPKKVLHNAINRGLAKIRTEGAREAAAIYTVSQSTIRSAAKISQINAITGEDVVGSINFSGHKLPLIKFKVSGGNRSLVRATVKKGGGGSLPSAFIKNMGYGTNVIERLTIARIPTETLMGLSAAQMIGAKESVPKIEAKAEETVSERIDHEIMRILNNW